MEAGEWEKLTWKEEARINIGRRGQKVGSKRRMGAGKGLKPVVISLPTPIPCI